MEQLGLQDLQGNQHKKVQTGSGGVLNFLILLPDFSSSDTVLLTLQVMLAQKVRKVE